MLYFILFCAILYCCTKLRLYF